MPMTLVLGTVVVLAIFAGGVLVKAVVPVIGGVLASTWLCAHARRRAARSERCQHDDEPETGSQQ
ncbi:hypothetical protein [Streptoalloteichus tenebrarius]|uniref:hypothetical protein n=1 Tax=Streptoalloteichus tenebrarius (strain ATCC 17920 / DSM 40477 / JCM 4838 / CBS 697.72 / NBRC 16177 / NCIMB 11028 / NRRL B-12390 / A12253. 1 / ISP 5477) TaxID=1933 RepID=UPI0020A504B5|nr:hypothetical protein [Streptoalloteichus tenebrarius]